MRVETEEIPDGLTICFGLTSYILEKRFGRGSYGEVWLAFHWNCYQGNSSEWRNYNASANSAHFDSTIRNSSSFSHNCNSRPPDDNLFILKRIMVGDTELFPYIRCALV